MVAHLISDELPAARLHLAFVPVEFHSERYWWPAIVYSSYLQAMADRVNTLSESVAERLAIKVIDERSRNLSSGSTTAPDINSANVAQLLGFEDEWMEINQHQRISAFLPCAVSQKVSPRHGHYEAFNLALEQLKDLLSCGATDASRIDELLGNATFVPSLLRVPHQSNTTTCPSHAIVSSQKRVVSDPTRVWGREKPRSKTSHVTSPAKRFQLTKRKAPHAIKRASSSSFKSPKKRVHKKSTATTKRTLHGASAQKSLRSQEEFYVFKNVWAHLKEDGWRYVKAVRNPVCDWYYVRPGKDPKTGILDVDYFATTDDVVDWAKSVNYRREVGVQTTDESSAGEEDEQSRISGTDADMSQAEETLGTTDDEDSRPTDENSYASCSTASIPSRSFSKTWRHLVKQGWHLDEARNYHPQAECAWYFLRPGVRNMLTAKRGRDYFASSAEVMDWVEENPHVMSEYPDDYEDKECARLITQPEDSGGGDYVVARAQKTRRITLSPAKPPSKVGRPSKKHKTKKPSNSAIKSRQKVAKTEWWHKHPVPSFTEIWHLLVSKLHFRYFSGKYRLPNGVKVHGSKGWSYDHDMRTFLCEHGIPNFDSSLLSTHEIMILMRWVTFANVPVSHANSVPILESLPVPSDPIPLLKRLGVSVLGAGEYVWQQVTYASLEELRVHIRGLPELVSGRRRQAIPLDDEQVLRLRLWAALSTEPLPVFGVTCEDGGVVAEIEEEGLHAAKQM